MSNGQVISYLILIVTVGVTYLSLELKGRNCKNYFEHMHAHTQLLLSTFVLNDVQGTST